MRNEIKKAISESVQDLKKQSDSNWERISTMKDSEIDLSGSPELDHDFFANATLRMPESKKAVSHRIDLGSPFDVKGIKTKVTTKEIVDIVRESRAR